MLPEGGESPPEFFLPRLLDGARALAIRLDAPPAGLLARYLALLDRARRRTNLTGPFSSEVLVDHALESALGAALLPPGRSVDVGSGAGFPGIPIAILRPDVPVLPVEPRRLRREFLDGCGRELPLPHLEAARAALRGVEKASASSAMARAVGGLADVLGSAAFLRPGGTLLVWTTEPGSLARDLDPVFDADGEVPVPGAERKRIARFRRRAVAAARLPHPTR